MAAFGGLTREFRTRAFRDIRLALCRRDRCPEGFETMTGIMKLLVAFALLQLLSSAAQAKFFRYDSPRQQRTNTLKAADSFSVECENRTTRVIDRESVDVDAGTVTIEIPGSAPVAHKILSYYVDQQQSTDQFGNPGIEVEVGMIRWSKTEYSGDYSDARLGQLYLPSVTGAPYGVSDHDGAVWHCTSPSYQ